MTLSSYVVSCAGILSPHSIIGSEKIIGIQSLWIRALMRTERFRCCKVLIGEQRLEQWFLFFQARSIFIIRLRKALKKAVAERPSKKAWWVATT
jgi:hypothetical protein